MSLRSKVGIIVICIFIVYGVVDFGIQRFTIFPSFLSLERDEAIKESKRSVQAIQREIHHLDSLCHDWAAWDDTYEFVESLSSDYIESNLVISSFTENSLNLVYICDNNGKVVWGEIRALETEKMINLDSFPKDGFTKTHPLISYQTGDKPLADVTIAGVFMTEQGPMLIASRPILNSNNEGPIRGSVIMGRFLNNNFVKMLADQTQVNLRVFPIQADSLPGHIKDIPSRVTEQSPYIVDINGDEHIDTYTTFPDIKGDTALLIRSKLPREIAAEGYATIRYAMYSVMVAGLVLLIVMLLLLQKTVLKPITELKNYTLSVGKTGDLSPRLFMQRRDEIGIIASELNNMLVQIEKSSSELEEMNTKLQEDNKKRKQAERELIEAREVAVAADKAKSQFLATISHELRTPLNHIIGFSDLIDDNSVGDLNQEQKEYLNHVCESSHHLLSLINDILDLSKVESGELELELSNVDLKMLLDNSLVMVRERATNHSIQLSIKIEEIPDTIKADERKLKQIIYNLLSNAVKFTPDGGEIRLTANLVQRSQLNSQGKSSSFQPSASDLERHGDFIEISVKDNGIGLEKDDLERIFSSFEQVESSLTRRYAGTGLGLSLTKNLVDLHGGRIWAESEGEGKGSTFSFVIPV